MEEQRVSWKKIEEHENIEKMENINQMTLYLWFKTLFLWLKLHLSTRWPKKTPYFTAFMGMVEKNHMRLESMILGQLKIGECQETFGGLWSTKQ